MLTADPPVIVLTGDRDVFTAAKMREALADVHEPAVIDLTQLRHLDASALGVLAAVARRVGIGRLTVVVPRGNLNRLLRTVGFPSLCRIITDRREKQAPGHSRRRRSDAAEIAAARAAVQAS